MCVSFSSVAKPVLAVELSNDIIEELIPEDSVPVDFSFNVYGDTIVFTDEEGMIVEVRGSDVTGYGLGIAGALTYIGSSGAGAIAAGSAAILTNALPILMFLTAVGVTIYSVEGIRDCVMDMYMLLSPVALAELAELAEQIKNGATQIFMSDSLIDELNRAMGDVFYTDDGYFKSIGITFDPTAMLAYDFSAQYVYGDQLTSTIYKYALSSTPVTFNKTSLSLSLVSSPFEVSGVNKAFKITNAVTGASLIYASSYKSDFLECDHCTYSISAPAVQSFSDLDGMVGNILGFWVLRECSIEASGGDCAECNFNRYNSSYFGESTNNTDINYLMFQGTGIDYLDNFVFQSQYYNGPRDWDLTLRTPTDGRTTVQVNSSAMSVIASDMEYTVAIAIDTTYPDSQTPIFVPPAQTLDNVNTLTQAGATTNDWSQSVDTPITSDTSTGIIGALTDWFGSLWEWLRSIWEAILNVPTAIVEAIEALALEIKNFFGNFWVMLDETLMEGLKKLFIPEDGYFDDFFNRLYETFSNRMGLLTYPMSLIFDFFNRLLTLSEQEPILRWNSWSYEGTVFIPAGSYNLNSMCRESEIIDTIHDIYLIFVDAVLVFAFVDFLYKKSRSVLSS